MRLRAILVSFALFAVAAAQAEGPPRARVEPVQDTYFGDIVTDPYRWMESGGPEFEAWMHAQDAVTRAEFAALPGRAALLKEVAASGEDIELLHSLVRVGSQLFYLKRAAGAERPVLYTRRVGRATETLLVDPATVVGGGKNSAIDYAVPSPDGRYVAFGLSRGGSEESVLRVFDVARRRVLSEAIDRCRFGSPEWVPGRPEFFYTRTRALQPGEARDQEFRDISIWHHRLEEDIGLDREVFDVATHDSALGHNAFPFISLASGGRYAFVQLNSGVSGDGPWYITARSELTKPHPAWRKLVDADARLLQYSSALEAGQRPIVRGDAAYFVSLKDAPRGRIVNVDLRAGHEGQATEVIAQGEDSLLGLAEARDGVYLARLAGNAYRVQRWLPQTSRVDSVEVPKDTAVFELVTDPHSAGVTLSLSSWTAPADYVSAGVGVTPHSWRLGNAKPPTGGAMEAETLDITARDGVKVPVTIVRRAGGDRSHPAAAFVEAYAAYGTSSDPVYTYRVQPWLQRGHLYVVVHARGGGEFGEPWHLAGKGANKPNTWRDVIDAIEALKKAGVVAADKVVAMGTSAGGIMIGRVVTERPDLLAGAIMNVPVADSLRFETTPGGPANTTEFGSVKDEAGYRALRVMSPYANVVDGTRYPPVLVTAGMNDKRVVAWVPAKMAARLQAAGANVPGAGAVRLRVEFDEGHGHGTSKAAADLKFTDSLAFGLGAVGDKDFR